MVKYVIRRLILLIPIMFFVSMIIFGMSRLVPGDPVLIMIGRHQVSPEVLENIREKYHLNKPVWEQYVIWLKNAATGDLGESFKLKQSVTYLIKERLPLTLQLVVMSTIITLIIAIPLGIVSAIKRNSWVDYASSLFALIGVSSPVYFTGILMILLFAFKLNWLPAFGTGDGFIANLKHLLLPSLALSASMIALTSRFTRSGMIDVLNTNYMQTAIAKGLPRYTIIFKHGLRNALIPLITVTGLQIAFLIVGTVMIEYTFGLGGLGSLIVNGIQTNDYPIVQGSVLFSVAVFLLLNLIMDVIYGIVDPRIRYK